MHLNLPVSEPRNHVWISNLSSENGIVVFEISNYYENSLTQQTMSHSGYGIINLRKRLDLTYPGKYQLNIEPGELLYHVKLTINTNAD